MTVEYLNGSISNYRPRGTKRKGAPPLKKTLLKTTLWYWHWRDVCILTYWSTPQPLGVIISYLQLETVGGGHHPHH